MMPVQLLANGNSLNKGIKGIWYCQFFFSEFCRIGSPLTRGPLEFSLSMV